jgi:hypothetical protein
MWDIKIETWSVDGRNLERKLAICRGESKTLNDMKSENSKRGKEGMTWVVTQKGRDEGSSDAAAWRRMGGAFLLTRLPVQFPVWDIGTGQRQIPAWKGARCNGKHTCREAGKSKLHRHKRPICHFSIGV